MKKALLSLVVCVIGLSGADAQFNAHPLPQPALMAKTVAIVNNTHNSAVGEGATEAVKRWGRFTIIDDSDVADLTLTFDKKSEHEGSSTQKTGADGKPDTSYSVTFSSSIHMRATVKGSESAFYSTTTDESKKKAGSVCVLDLQKAYLAAPR